ncbi:MAG TPA: PD-(D/E)XK nuclease family protein [Burkholderiaceae bacterium]|nr:PD-(D/E)XK nuclease family protein [Burkholderiaceae bacterium]
MLHSPLLIPPSAVFWPQVARALLGSELLFATGRGQQRDLSSIRVVVPTFVHAQLLKAALAAQLDGAFIPPRIVTLSAWLALLPPDAATVPAAGGSQRLMSLYAELRQHGWLKKLFTARRNTDLLPLAQTLLTLSDELTQSLLPAMRSAPESVEHRWQAALAQLSPSARHLLSDEAQLVWSIWKSQLGGSDACVVRFAQMMRLAQRAEEPMIWIAPVEPDAFDRAFLDAYGKRQTVLPIMLDWRAASIDAIYAMAWPELPEADASVPASFAATGITAPAGVSICAAASLEDEALRGAQTIIDWLVAGKSNIAIIAQDRAVARRVRALLERAQVYVADETGWKLSTTRAAAAIAAWFEVVASRAETIALLDLLKSPFLFTEVADKSAQVMAIEIGLRSANVMGGWDAVTAALPGMLAVRDCVLRMARQAGLFTGRKTLPEWIAMTNNALQELGMLGALKDDAAGQQVIAMMEAIEQDCHSLTQPFSFAEWRAFVGLQLEATPFVPPGSDRRVVMLPLNGARLRTFDAVLMVGADADHLPSRPNETLFFANAVRRELGLATRESRQRQQLRDFTELLSASSTVVLCWQAHKDGEPNPVSIWIERLQLALERCGAEKLRAHQVRILSRRLIPSLPVRPAPAAPQLLPRKLSASGYNSLVACPYQFFATRMLGLSGLDEFSEMPEKRDYGDWLHQILTIYHDTVRDRKTGLDGRENLLKEVSGKIFGDAMKKNAAVLGYYARWEKVIPAYLAWANARESEGWRFVLGERWFERTLQWTDGAITLHGRVDRIDENDAGERAVLDYKTRHVQALRDKLKEGEDHQLAFYGLLSDLPVTAAHYVALEAVKDRTGDAGAARYAEWQHALGEQIVANMQAIAQGAALSASGIELVCRYCDVRGLCRKGAW